MTIRLLTTTLIACGLAACGDKPTAPTSTPETVVETPVTSPAAVQEARGPDFKPGDFVTNPPGLPVRISDRITVESDAVMLRVKNQFPTLGLNETYSMVEGQDYLVTVDLGVEERVGDIGFRVVAWPLNAEGKPLDAKTYTAIGSKFDETAGRQTLRFRFGPAVGETEAPNRLPNVAADAVRFLLVPVSKTDGTVVSVYNMTVELD